MPFIGIDGQKIREFGEKIGEMTENVGKLVIVCAILSLFFVAVGYVVGEFDGSNERLAQEQHDQDDAERIAAEEDQRLRSYETKEE